MNADENRKLMRTAQLDQAVWDLVTEELARARQKFPEPDYQLAAAVEELGELAKAILHKVQQNESAPYAADDVLKEAVQTVGCIVRLVVEGDLSLKLEPTLTQEETQ